MYWRPSQYPTLASLSRAERKATLRAALGEYGRGYRIRLFVLYMGASVLGFSVVGTSAGDWLAAAPVSDWRKWAPLVVFGALTYGLYLLEVNGSIHTAVKRYRGKSKELPNPPLQRTGLTPRR
jgi:peptidoglycan/LPS O-acetylase OafA/YrhL